MALHRNELRLRARVCVTLPFVRFHKFLFPSHYQGADPTVSQHYPHGIDGPLRASGPVQFAQAASSVAAPATASVSASAAAAISTPAILQYLWQLPPPFATWIVRTCEEMRRSAHYITSNHPLAPLWAGQTICKCCGSSNGEDVPAFLLSPASMCTVAYVYLRKTPSTALPPHQACFHSFCEPCFWRVSVCGARAWDEIRCPFAGCDVDLRPSATASVPPLMPAPLPARESALTRDADSERVAAPGTASNAAASVNAVAAATVVDLSLLSRDEFPPEYIYRCSLQRWLALPLIPAVMYARKKPIAGAADFDASADTAGTDADGSTCGDTSGTGNTTISVSHSDADRSTAATSGSVSDASTTAAFTATTATSTAAVAAAAAAAAVSDRKPAFCAMPRAHLAHQYIGTVRSQRSAELEKAAFDGCARFVLTAPCFVFVRALGTGKPIMFLPYPVQ
jgi:hypothetical protein